MSLNKKIQSAIKTLPKYKVQSEYDENQGLARSLAFGRDRAVMNQEDNIKSATSSAMDAAAQASNSGSGILATLGAINANQQSNFKDLAGTEASIKAANMQGLQNANTAMAEEKDKEWEHNVNTPAQLKLQALVERKKRRDELAQQAIIAGIGVAGSVATGMMGGGGGDKAKKLMTGGMG